MRFWGISIIIFCISMGCVGIASHAWASSDLIEVGAVAEGMEGSTRTWAYRAFIVLALVAALIAFVTSHSGVAMGAMAVLFLGAFLARGPDAISETTGLAEGATLEAIAPPVTDAFPPLPGEID